MQQVPCICSLTLPLVLDVLVDEERQRNGGQGIVPARDEHETETQDHPEEGQAPVVVPTCT